MTEPFDDLVREPMAAEPGFSEALRQEALDAIREGDLVTGRSMMQRYFGETGLAAGARADSALGGAK